MSNRLTKGEALSFEGLYGTTALVIFIDEYGAGCVDWDPDTVEMEALSLSARVDPGVLDRLNAALTVLSSDAPHWDPLAFNNIVRTLNFDSVSASSYIPADIGDLAWGCTEMRLLEGAEDFDKAGFLPDIKSLVGQSLIFSGITNVPKALNFADMPEEALLSRDDNLGADSVMFESYWSSQKETDDSLSDYVDGNLKSLINQLNSLTLKNADGEFSKQAERALRALAQ